MRRRPNLCTPGDKMCPSVYMGSAGAQGPAGCSFYSMENVIDVAELSKRVGTTQALDRLDLTVRAGEVHGFLGPNGAGKTTTIRILLGLLRADSGRATLLGGD